MKGIGLILFSIAMFVFGIFSAVMLFQSDWYFWVATLLIALIAGIITAILGLILVCRQDSSRKTREQDAPALHWQEELKK